MAYDWMSNESHGIMPMLSNLGGHFNLIMSYFRTEALCFCDQVIPKLLLRLLSLIKKI